MKIKPLTHEKSIIWYSASAVYGLVLVIFAAQSEYLEKDAVPIFGAIVFIASWLIGVVGLRFYLSDVKGNVES